MIPPPTTMTRVLGIDFGTRRVGAAVSDPRRQIATPLEVYERRDTNQDARHYQALVADHDIDLIVVGLPLHTSGGESESSRQARAWGDWLGTLTGIPVRYHDERYSTVDAIAILRSSGAKRKDRQSRRDMLAARILLQSFLDAGCPTDAAPWAPLMND